MVGATSSSNGSVGYVNAVPPKDGYNTKYLRADGTWQVPPDHTYNVYNKTLTIQKNGTNVATFTSNSNTDVTANISVPTKTSDLTNDSGFLTSHQSLANYVTLNDAQTIPGNKTFSGLTKTTGKYPYSYSGNDLNNAIYNMETTYWAPDTANRPSSSDYGTLLSFNREVNVHTSNGTGWIAQFGIGTDSRLYLRTKTNLGGVWENWKEFITINDAVPRNGGVLGSRCKYTCDTTSSYVYIYSGTDWYNGAGIALNGGTFSNEPGVIDLQACIGIDNRKKMQIRPNGTWTWDGQAVQLVSDQRFKQQINAIDDKLLDAWQDVDLVQFKYNDSVNEKGDNARLHTGYVVQQIDKACANHGVDISAYGLYCHEEYPEETEEVEVEQKDGTTTKETKVIRESSEHYSLRYTETLVVECAYLRRENARLKERLQRHDDYFSNIEKRLQSLENS